MRPLLRPLLASASWSLIAAFSVPGATPGAAAAPKAVEAPHTAAPEPAPRDRPSPFERATLAAALDANRIAEEGVSVQVEAARWQAGLAFGALVLSAIAGLAAVAAAVYARRAWRENRRSADVAERILSGYERPFLLLEVVTSGVSFAEKSITFDVTKYRFRNLGRVPALITRRHFELEDSADMPDPVDPDKEAGRPVVHGVAVGANAASEEIETGRALPLLSALKPGRKPKVGKDRERPTVYFHGFVEYRDLAGRGWITGFCFAQSDNEAGFQPLSLTAQGEPDPYNYDRQVG
jgi:hypothetical protein